MIVSSKQPCISQIVSIFFSVNISELYDSINWSRYIMNTYVLLFF